MLFFTCFQIHESSSDPDPHEEEHHRMASIRLHQKLLHSYNKPLLYHPDDVSCVKFEFRIWQNQKMSVLTNPTDPNCLVPILIIFETNFKHLMLRSKPI